MRPAEYTPDEIIQAGQDLQAGGRNVTGFARIVRAGKAGAPAVTDGPYAEGKEFLAGYWIVDVPSAERAYEIAAEASMAPGPGGKPMHLAIEVRGIPSGPPPIE